MSQLDTDRNPVDELAEEFVASYRRGENPSIMDYARRYPELADQIHELFPAAILLEELKGPSTPRVPDAPVPTQLGDFRILREIGRGGMGVVYEAEQVSLSRRVALKVLPAHARIAPEQLERFRREARAAGRLHHTNIVPVFGVGEHEGMPYYVMQYIAGQGLERVLARLRHARSRPSADPASTHVPPGGLLADPTMTPGDSAQPAPPGDPTISWTDTKPSPGAQRSNPESDSLPTPDSPAYFRLVTGITAQVAEALAYAHGQGILHRDVKPANLLLDRQGAVWITDFGLAKLLEQDDLTRPGEVAGTLRYSAPERFKGRSDARSDIYSLGLTLYELLTLRPAYDEPDPGALLLQVTNGRIIPPRQVNRAVPRDLETIALRCLAPEPEERYQNAAELADDLRRFLDDRPIKARRTSPLEHAWRWCRRNPAVASLSAALLLVFLIGFAGVFWQWREASANLDLARKSEKLTRDALHREEQERGRADEQRRRAEGNLNLALEAFDRIARQLASGRPGVPVDEGDEMPETPIVSPEVAAILQDIVAVQDRFAATNSNDPRLRRDTARALRQVGTIRLRLGEYSNAVEALTKATELLAGEQEQKFDLAQTQNDLGVVLRAAGKFPEALAAHEQASKIIEALPEPAPSRVRLELARTHNLRGALEGRYSRLSTAEQSQRKALAVLETLLEEDENNPEYRHLLARASHDLSNTLWAPSRRKEGAEARSRALKVQEELASDFPNVPDYRAELAEMLLAFHHRFAPLKTPEEGETRSSRAVEIAADLVAKYPAVPNFQALLARARLRLAQVQIQSEKTSEAVENLRQTIKLYENLQSRFPGSLAYRFPSMDARFVLGELLREQGYIDESAQMLSASLTEVKKLMSLVSRKGFLRRFLVRNYRSLADTLRIQGNSDEADRLQLIADEMTNMPRREREPQ